MGSNWHELATQAAAKDRKEARSQVVREFEITEAFENEGLHAKALETKLDLQSDDLMNSKLVAAIQHLGQCTGQQDGITKALKLLKDVLFGAQLGFLQDDCLLYRRLAESRTGAEAYTTVMAVAGEFGHSAWQTARFEWTLFCTFRTAGDIPRSVVEPLTLAAFAQSRLETFVAEEARKPTNRRSGASIPSSVSTMARVYARMNGVDLPLLLSGGLRALTRASSSRTRYAPVANLTPSRANSLT